MLIEKPFDVGDVVCLRMMTGEEVIGRVAEVPTGVEITISRPIMLSVVYDPKTHTPMGIQFLPWSHGADDGGKFRIQRDHLLCDVVKARKDMSDEYARSTSSLDLPQKSGLVI